MAGKKTKASQVPSQTHVPADRKDCNYREEILTNARPKFDDQRGGPVPPETLMRNGGMLFRGHKDKR